MNGKLEQYFEGEEIWIKYSSLFGDDWTNSELQIKLLRICNDHLDIAKVIFYELGEGSIKWMNSKVPALDNLSPVECLNNEDLIKRLKVCLHRFPS